MSEPVMMSRATHKVPPLPHERMQQLVPALRDVVPAIASRARAMGFESAGQCVFDMRGDHPEVEQLAESYYFLSQAHGRDPAGAEKSTLLLLEHVAYSINHELHRRRTFWVDESLSWMLAETRLDIEGRLLRLPFPISCFVFTDMRMREIGQRVLRALGDKLPVVPRVVTFYVLEIPHEDEGRGIRIMMLLDERDDEWPTLISRDLLIRDEADLGEILESHFADVDDADDFFESEAMKEALGLLVNAILYVTCADVVSLALESPLTRIAGTKATRPPPHGRAARTERREAAILEKRFSADDVVHLPGKISISRLRDLQGLRGNDEGREMLRRFMVRGHWRRAPADWTDRRLRWIEPYWKGPDIAVAIERQYRLKA